MSTAEFDKPAGPMPLTTGPITPFPDAGMPEAEVIAAIRALAGQNPYP